jgi:hypothetical protein
MITIAATPPIATPTISPVDKEGLAKKNKNYSDCKKEKEY